MKKILSVTHALIIYMLLPAIVPICCAFVPVSPRRQNLFHRRSAVHASLQERGNAHARERKLKALLDVPWNNTAVVYDAIQAAWGNYPLLLRGAFADTETESDVSSLSALPVWEEIIQLACGQGDVENKDDESSIEMDEDVPPSRLIAQRIAGRMDSYELLGFGPFADAKYLHQQLQPSASSTSTLVVNDVDRWIPELSDWMDVNFGSLIPRWRRDDAQISLANQGGGIGPHVDSYDVFLLQLAGSREWQVGDNFLVSIQEEFDHMIEACSEKGVRILNITSLLEASSTKNPDIVKIQVQPGDCLYLPPRIMHWGTATTDGCMTLSVGCRAPSAKDLIGRLSERLLLYSSAISSSLREKLEQRYTDEIVRNVNSTTSSELTRDVKGAMRELVLEAAIEAALDDDNFFDPLIGKVVTEPNRISGDESSFPLSLDDMDEQWRSELGVWGTAAGCLEEVFVNGNGCLRRVEGIACAWSRDIDTKAKHVTYRVYCHGRDSIEFAVSNNDDHEALTSLMDQICGGPPLDQSGVEKLGIRVDEKHELRSFLLAFVQEGWLYGDDA